MSGLSAKSPPRYRRCRLGAAPVDLRLHSGIEGRPQRWPWGDEEWTADLSGRVLRPRRRRVVGAGQDYRLGGVRSWEIGLGGRDRGSDRIRPVDALHRQHGRGHGQGHSGHSQERTEKGNEEPPRQEEIGPPPSTWVRQSRKESPACTRPSASSPEKGYPPGLWTSAPP